MIALESSGNCDITVRTRLNLVMKMRAFTWFLSKHGLAGEAVGAHSTVRVFLPMASIECIEVDELSAVGES